MSAFVRPRAPDGHTPAVAQIAIVALVGLGVGVGFGLLVSPLLAPLAGWDVAAATWLAIVWSKIWPMDAARTARLAAFEDPNRAIRDIVLVGAGVASLLAVVMVIAAAAMAPRGVPRDLYGAAGVVSVLLSWLVVHTVFTARYARVYYTGPDGASTSTRRSRRATRTSRTWRSRSARPSRSPTRTSPARRCAGPSSCTRFCRTCSARSSSR